MEPSPVNSPTQFSGVENLRATAAPRAGFWDRIGEHFLVRAFSQMSRGSLGLVGPDGRFQKFGSESRGPAAELRINTRRVYSQCLFHGDIGFGDAYVAGDWDTPDLCAVFSWFVANVESAPTLSGARQGGHGLNWARRLHRVRHWLRRNSLGGSVQNIGDHYDLGNAFYELWLDHSMTYSSALFTSEEQSLESAQEAKYERLCQQLRLRPADHILEIGSGWGGFALHAARRYGCRVTTLTLSREQLAHVRRRVQTAGLAGRVEVLLRDYREMTGCFDRICSIEMMEAVGDEYLERFFERIESLLAPDGLFAAQFITCPDSRHSEFLNNVDWIQSRIFPGSLLLSLARILEITRRHCRLDLFDLHDLGLSYSRTLNQWRSRFNGQQEAIRRLGFDERFIRSWNYYLAYCEAAFATRNISVVQAVWSRPNNSTLNGFGRDR